MANLSQAELASAASVNVNTIRAMEARSTTTLVSGLDVILKVQRALETAGVEFIAENGGGPGVRLRKGSAG